MDSWSREYLCLPLDNYQKGCTIICNVYVSSILLKNMYFSKLNCVYRN